MNNDGKLDNLLHKVCQENKTELLSLGTDFSKIEKRALEAYKNKNRYHNAKVIIRVVISAVITIVLLNTFLFFGEFEPVKAYRAELKQFVFNIFSSKTNDNVEIQYRRVSNEIQKIQALILYKIPISGWIPEEYVFNNVEMRNDGNDIQSVRIKYTSKNDQLSIDISNDTSTSSTIPILEEGSYEKVTIQGLEVYLVSIQNNDIVRSKCFFYSKEGLSIYISGGIDRQSLIKIIESLK